MKVIDAVVEQCLKAALAAGIASGPVAAPFALRTEMLPEGFSAWVPGAPAPVVFIGDSTLVPQRLVAAILRSGRTRIFCRDADIWCRVGVARILSCRSRAAILDWLRHRPDDHPLVRTLRRRPRNLPPAGTPEPADTAVWSQIVDAATDRPVPSHREMIVHVNVGLGAGGAERQIVDTLLGLAARGHLAAFVGEELDLPGLRFHASSLDAAGIPVEGPVPPAPDWRDLDPAIGASLAGLPAIPAGRIVALTRTFNRLRPRVVHAWQDESGAVGALAALVAGVPKIVISGVSIAPAWVEDLGAWIGPALRAAAASDRVVLTNNSRAGARSYAAYLGVPESRITVLANGIDVERLDREALKAADFRREFDLRPEHRLVVGLLRLAPEKRPLLWIDTAIEAARRCPDMHFVLIGDGPLGPACRARIASSGLGNRLRNIPPRQSVGAAIAAAQGLLLTSKIEGMPNVVLESMVLGTPVVATRAGDLDGLMEPPEGWLMPADADRDGLAAVLGQLPVPGAARPVRGRPAILERFALNTMIELTCRLYGSQ